MTLWFELHNSIHLEGIAIGERKSKRIEPEDAERQAATARAILQRLNEQPGVVLADEVGMGKTFVALAVATSITLGDAERRPVVVMVPPSLIEKWPRDFSYFASKCLDPKLAQGVRCQSAATGVELLKLLDDKIDAPNRASIIFLTHGAMHRGLTDGWVKLAVIQRALKFRRETQTIRRALSRCASELLQLKSAIGSPTDDRTGRSIWERLLDEPPEGWLKVLHSVGIGPSGAPKSDSDDAPVPEAVTKALDAADASRDFDLQTVYDRLDEIPQRETPSWKQRVTDARRELNTPLKEVWKQCLKKLSSKLPLLVLDEAHHLKNANTNLAKLFHTADGEKVADELAYGALAGVFERMLFLTATPFQLGHAELCSVLERFQGIDWTHSPISGGKEDFQKRLDELRARLDAAQYATLRLEECWGKLRTRDLVINGEQAAEFDVWWEFVNNGGARSSVAGSVVESFGVANDAMRAAEAFLRPFVVRHLRKRVFKGQPRRLRLPGAAILNDAAVTLEQGIEVRGAALVPFLLAARATTCKPNDRPVFAEGLASSYEAFRKTRHPDDETKKTGTGVGTDGDDSNSTSEDTALSVSPIVKPKSASAAEPADWYLDQLEILLPSDDVASSATHPKVAATVQRVLEAWKDHEKVLVFCHFIATGQTLNKVISESLNQEIDRLAAEKMSCSPHEAGDRLAKFGNQFRRADADSPARRAVNAKVDELLKEFPNLDPLRDDLQRVCRRFVRTPSFLVRYFPLNEDRLDAAAIKQAFAADVSSGLSLSAILMAYFGFLSNDCEDSERQSYLDAILGTHRIASRDSANLGSGPSQVDPVTQTERHTPNVRLVNGPTDSETRQRLMLTFNSPFFPEVLIASSVMAEGVDLHRFCRYVIHHDLSWNPSTLEQRTGRVDRIGAKVEQCGLPVRVYLPYLGETQDEKQYRVVMDRERWFSVVMGEKFRTDARHTDRLSDRVPFPESLARQLAFRLEAIN